MNKNSSSRAIFLELLLNFVLFTICMAVCLQIFAQAYTTSNRSRSIARASVVAQSIAASFKAAEGDLSQLEQLHGGTLDESGALWLEYDQDWEPSQLPGQYRVCVQPVSSENGLHTALISCKERKDQESEILSLQVSRFAAEEGGDEIE